MQRVELQLSSGQLAVIEVKGDRITLSVDGVALLALSRSDAWRLAEALDALSTQP